MHCPTQRGSLFTDSLVLLLGIQPGLQALHGGQSPTTHYHIAPDIELGRTKTTGHCLVEELARLGPGGWNLFAL